jgi:hypothetical protein
MNRRKADVRTSQQARLFGDCLCISPSETVRGRNTSKVQALELTPVDCLYDRNEINTMLRVASAIAEYSIT